jgi:sec-independent protein translocase protein TatA
VAAKWSDKKMGSLSIWHWLIFLVVALLLFGGSGKISSIMGDVAKGIKSFKKGMSEDEAAAAPAQDPFKKEEPKAIDSAARPAATTQATPATQPAAQPAAQPAPQVNKVG